MNTRRNHPFVIGAQFRAGRALVRWRRVDLAKAAGLHRNAVAYWERQQRIPDREPFACEKMRVALLAAGVVAVTTPAPGVCRVGLMPASAITVGCAVPESQTAAVSTAEEQ